MSVELALEQFNPGKELGRQVTHRETLQPQESVCTPFPESIPETIRDAYRSQGIEAPYTHQAKTAELALQGKNCVVVTPTASGKSLAYNLPVLSTLLTEPDARALYLFPTKALAQDQTASLNSMLQGHPELDPLKVFTFDGDTPSSIRPSVRTKGRIIISNPDMLHGGILPNHTKWTKVLRGLRYVIIDEMHTYRGLFGSHLANLITRLKRIAAFYGADPTFILCSATIANPKELAEELIGKKVELIDNNGAPTAEKHILLYNPPLVDPGQGIRRGVVLESVRVAAAFVEQGVQTIVFARSRQNTELIASYLKKRFKSKAERITAYRGGFLPGERRRIEKGLRDGSVLCVVSTNALELGIDIGQLEAAVLAGYPGSVASLLQQAGRAGRSRTASAVVVVASSAPVDQYVINHPDYLFSSGGETAFVNRRNLHILMSHLKCSAFELPFKENETFDGERITEALEYLGENRVLNKSGDSWYWMEQSYPAEEISLRSSTAGNFVIINRGSVDLETATTEVIGEVDRASAPFFLFEGAVYIHGSRQFQVEKLDYENRKAYVREVKADYYTDAIDKTDIKILDTEMSSEGAPQLNYGEILVRTQVYKYKKLKFGTHENIGYGEIHLPEEQMHTESCWISFPETVFEGMDEKDRQDALLGISVLLKNLTPVYLLCSTRDIHTSAQVKNLQTGLPCVFLFDTCPGGAGLSRKAFSVYPLLFTESARHMESCPCDNGCPSCIGPAEYGYSDGFKSRLAVLLERINSGLHRGHDGSGQ